MYESLGRFQELGSPGPGPGRHPADAVAATVETMLRDPRDVKAMSGGAALAMIVDLLA